MPRLHLILLMVGFVTMASCALLQGPKTGDVAFKEYQYASAVGLYEKELVKETDPKEKARKAFQIGECYRMSGNFTKATPWYKKAADEGYDAEAIFLYASMLKMDEDYDEALTQFQNYLKAKPDDDERVNAELKSCTLSKEWKQSANQFIIKNEAVLNSPAFDYSPVIFKKGIAFTTDRPEVNGEDVYGWTGEHYSDIFFSDRDAAGNLTQPVPFSKTINTPYNEGVICFTKDFNECYFTRCGSKSTTTDYCKIWHSIWNNETSEWGPAEQIELFRSDSVNESKPCLSPDGNDIYFSANAKDGYGGYDLYVSHKSGDGGWTEPENLGGRINTPGNEFFPYMADDGKLYFSSDGLPGMGGLDIFVTQKIANGWTYPVNLKSPINSGADDFGIIFVPLNNKEKDTLKLKGYFSSNRPGGKGNDDIYSFAMRRIKYYGIHVQVYEKVLRDSLDPNSPIIRLKPLANSKVTVVETDTFRKADKTLPLMETDKNGKLSFTARSDYKYTFKVTHEPFFFAQNAEFRTKGFNKRPTDTVIGELKILMDKVPFDTSSQAVAESGPTKTIGNGADTGKRKPITGIGGGWTIHNIYYDLNRANLRELSLRVLDTFYNKLKENPRLIVELGSHTDCRGSHELNMALSQHRADTAVMYLISKGLAPDRIVAKGYGETVPVINCPVCKDCTEEQHQQNRRTTIRIIGIKKE